MNACFQVSGAGNDFIALVEPAADPDPEAIRAWCRRAVSIGADGVFTIARRGAVVRMRHWNADGGSSALCLNGSRCAAQLAFHLGWHRRSLSLETGAGVLEARRIDRRQVALTLPPVDRRPVAASFDAAGASFAAQVLRVGVPHLVVTWPAPLDEVPVQTLGAALRAHPALADLGYPAGANVDFVRLVDRHRIDLRTFERGVEGETLACGTGAVAATVAGVAGGALEPPVAARTAGGFTLTVDGVVEGGLLGACSLAGDARILARGTLLDGAAAVPAATVWR